MAGVSDFAGSEFLQDCGLDGKEAEVEQLRIFVEALGIYADRDAARGEAWREFGTEDKAHHIRSKAARISAGIGRVNIGSIKITDLVDEALDIINYAAFFVRQAREEDAS